MNDADTKEPAQPERDSEPKQASEAESASPAEPSGSADRASSSNESRPNGDRGLIYWIAVIVVLLGVELYFYGSRGEMTVCVAKEGVHDFRLLGTPRTDENRWKFPFCEDRVNLGLRSQFDDLGRDALKVACRRATLMHFKDEQNACIAGDKSWKRKVTTKQVPPWNRRFYRRLFLIDR